MCCSQGCVQLYSLSSTGGRILFKIRNIGRKQENNNMRSEEMQEKRRKEIYAINVRICKNWENEGKSCMYLYVFSVLSAGATLSSITV